MVVGSSTQELSSFNLRIFCGFILMKEDILISNIVLIPSAIGKNIFTTSLNYGM